MENLLFGVGVLVAVAAIPLLITKFVVDATERDLARQQAEATGHFVKESWYWAAVKAGFYFAVVGSFFGMLPFIVLAAFASSGQMDAIGVLVGTITFYLLALFFGGGLAFLVGVGFGLVISRIGAVSWWWRALFGGLLGFLAGLLVFGAGTPSLWIALSWYAPPGAICGLTVCGRVYRWIFLAARPLPQAS